MVWSSATFGPGLVLNGMHRRPGGWVGPKKIK
jgi:hypothetical protein